MVAVPQLMVDVHVQICQLIDTNAYQGVVIAYHSFAAKGLKIIDLDGLAVRLRMYWASIRASHYTL